MSIAIDGFSPFEIGYYIWAFLLGDNNVDAATIATVPLSLKKKVYPRVYCPKDKVPSERWNNTINRPWSTEMVGRRFRSQGDLSLKQSANDPSPAGHELTGHFLLGYADNMYSVYPQTMILYHYL